MTLNPEVTEGIPLVGCFCKLVLRFKPYTLAHPACQPPVKKRFSVCPSFPQPVSPLYVMTQAGNDRKLQLKAPKNGIFTLEEEERTAVKVFLGGQLVSALLPTHFEF